MDAVSKRELSVLRRLGKLFENMAKKTIANNQAFLEDEIVVRVTSNRKEDEFRTVKRVDLLGNVDVKIKISTPERDNETANDLAMLLQTSAASLNPEISKIIWAKIASLKKQPDLARAVSEYQPQPDPLEEEAKRLEIENKKLENNRIQMEILKIAKDIENTDAMIKERLSRATLHGADLQSKEAKAQESQAKARKLDSEADIADTKFVRMNDGSEKLDELQKELIKTAQMQDAHNMELEKMQMEHLNDREKKILDHKSKTELNKESVLGDALLNAQKENQQQVAQRQF
jgi:hypothetical protein